MNIIALDTSTEACSAALRRADGERFAEFDSQPRQHNRLLPHMMLQVLKDAGLERADLTHCAFANGPGAFTGIRIAASQAQGVAIALGIPLLPISTLAVLAQTGIDRYGCQRPLVALDARMQEIYWAQYAAEDGRARLLGEERISGPGELNIDPATDCGLGHGWLEQLRPRAGFDVHADLLPDAAALLRLALPLAAAGCGVTAGTVGINYLRNRVAEKSRR